MNKSHNLTVTGNVFTHTHAAFYPKNRLYIKSDLPGQKWPLFDDGEIKVIDMQDVNGFCKVTYIYTDSPTQPCNSIFDEYGIDEHGYLGGFAIQQAVDLFYAEQSALSAI